MGNVGGRQWDFADEVREMMAYRYAKIGLKGDFYPESFARMAEQGNISLRRGHIQGLQSRT